MDLSAAHHQQLLQYPTQSSPNSTPTTHTLNNMTPHSTIQQSAAENSSNTESQTKPRPPETEPQQCPRCESTNTKFCYFNNYSLTQPRYFCKACRRYWTKGGTLRNVPVGGGCRKSAKRASSNSPNSHYLKRPHTETQLHPTNPVFSGYPAGMVLTEFDAGFNNFLGHQAFLQDLQYGNAGAGFMFQNNYEGGHSNSGSVISDEVKQERVENGAFWEAPWQNGNRMMLNGEAEEAVRDNWNGLYANNYSVLGGLLNSPAALM